MKIKKLIFVAPVSVVPIAISSVSCIKTSDLNVSSTLSLHIPKQFDIIPQVTSKKDEVTDNIIKSLLTLTFEDDIVRKNEYIKSQENEEKLFNEVKELSKRIPFFVKKKNNDKPGKDHFDIMAKHYEELNNFYSKNWLFMLKNIDKFVIRPFKVWTLEPSGSAKHTDDFINKSKDQNPGLDSFSFFNKNLDSLVQGGESTHTPGRKVMYIKKDKLIIRAIISKDDQNPFKIDKFIHFSLHSKDTKISIKLISDIIHSGTYHQDPNGFISFEEDLVKSNYSYPFISTLTLGENTNDKK
ncbi:hypothetical protein MBOVa_2500 [Mycoplasmopsis bovis 8790]|nr:hypothetical protein MBOVa_2500 [Mycoplasmopsis bovis 8790]